MALSFRHGLQSGAWPDIVAGKTPRPGAQVARAAKFFMMAQAEAGHLCPVTMTHAAFATLAADPDLLSRLAPKMANSAYDASFAPIAEKNAIT